MKLIEKLSIYQPVKKLAGPLQLLYVAATLVQAVPLVTEERSEDKEVQPSKYFIMLLKYACCGAAFAYFPHLQT